MIGYVQVFFLVFVFTFDLSIVKIIEQLNELKIKE